MTDALWDYDLPVTLNDNGYVVDCDISADQLDHLLKGGRMVLTVSTGSIVAKIDVFLKEGRAMTVYDVYLKDVWVATFRELDHAYMAVRGTDAQVRPRWDTSRQPANASTGA